MPDRQPNYGLVLAAGRGRRFGRPKQFVRVAGKPLLAWALEAFQACRDVAGYALVVPGDRLDYARRLGRRLGLTRLHFVVAGGPSRAASVLNGLRALPPSGCVAVHDAARPLLTPAMLTRGFAVCRRRGAVTYAFPVVDAVKRVSRGRLTATVDRTGLFSVQTPQFFRTRLLLGAYAAAGSAAARAPDDCALVERLGRRPVVIPGPHTNIKVTSVDDLAMVKAWLRG